MGAWCIVYLWGSYGVIDSYGVTFQLLSGKQYVTAVLALLSMLSRDLELTQD